MFFFGFFLGFASCLVFFLIGFVIWKELIFKYGKSIKRVIERRLNEFEEQTKDSTQIIYPDLTKEIFKKDGTKIEDFLT